MAKNRIKKVVKVKDEETEMGIKTLVFTFVAMILLSLFVYYLTDSMKKRENNNKEPEVVEKDYKNILISDAFNQAEKEYYVLIYDYKDKFVSFFQELVDTYHDPMIKIYTSNLKEGLNASFVSDKSNKEAQTLKELKVKGETLLKIKDGKIIKFLESPETISAELKNK